VEKERGNKKPAPNKIKRASVRTWNGHLSQRLHSKTETGDLLVYNSTREHKEQEKERNHHAECKNQ